MRRGMGIARLCAIALVAAMAPAACARSGKASRAAGEDTSGSAAAADREAACASAVRKGPLAWFEDDYAAALACARAAISSALSRNTARVPLPTVPKPQMPIFTGFKLFPVLETGGNT